MRFIMIGAVSAGLAWAAAAGTASAQASPVLPGYWDSTEQYSVLLSGEGNARKCLSEAQVAEFLQAPHNSHYRCRYASRSVGGGRASFRGGSCYDKHGRLTLSHVDVDGSYAPEDFHLDFRFGLNLSAGVALPGTAHIDAHRIAAECPVQDVSGR